MYAFFDIGGTQTRVAVSEDLKTFATAPALYDTPQEYSLGLQKLKETIRQQAGTRRLDLIVGGIAGPFSARDHFLVKSPNLPDWVAKPLVSDLEDYFKAAVLVENDAALVGLGEMHHGAGSGYDIGAYITIGTGIGGARYVQGKIDVKSIGFEPGHQIIDAGRALCPDCRGATLEDYISGKATEERMKQKPYEIIDPAFWTQYAKILSHGVLNSIVHWSPDVVVLGGSMVVGDPAISVRETKQFLETLPHIFPILPEIKKAELQQFGGLHGALIFAEQYKKENL